MADLDAFSARNFDPKAWINQACLARPAQDPLERHLAELEMRLHLAAEDVEVALQEQSRDALYRIPAAVQEVSHVKVCGAHSQLHSCVCRSMPNGFLCREICCH